MAEEADQFDAIIHIDETHALEPLDARLAQSQAIVPESYFRGIWDTNVLDGATFGVPWYVDTRLLFYRRDLLRKAGYDSVPGDWEGWRAAMAAVVRQQGPGHYAIFLPLNEWQPQAIFGLQAGSPLLGDRATRGAFKQPAFQRAFTYYTGLFRDGLAPPVRMGMPGG